MTLTDEELRSISCIEPGQNGLKARDVEAGIKRLGDEIKARKAELVSLGLSGSTICIDSQICKLVVCVKALVVKHTAAIASRSDAVATAPQNRRPSSVAVGGAVDSRCSTPAGGSAVTSVMLDALAAAASKHKQKNDDPRMPQVRKKSDVNTFTRFGGGHCRSPTISAHRRTDDGSGSANKQSQTFVVKGSPVLGARHSASDIKARSSLARVGSLAIGRAAAV